METHLNPTLWRTCRILANEARWKLLDFVIKNPGLPVKEITQLTGLSISSASYGLRLLQSRGLISRKPEGPFVLYEAVANESIPSSVKLLEAIKKQLKKSNRYHNVHDYLTCFTYERRIRILNHLQQNDYTFNELRASVKISKKALYYHLDKLLRREVIQLSKGVYRLCPPRQDFMKDLLKIITAPDFDLASE